MRDIIETDTATVARVADDLVICRYKPQAVISAQAVRENLEARSRLPGERPTAVIGIFPEDVDFDMTLLGRDHYVEVDVNDRTRVLAIVAEGSLFNRIAHLYFAYYPTHFRTQVFQQLSEALVWVEQQVHLLGPQGPSAGKA